MGTEQAGRTAALGWGRVLDTPFHWVGVPIVAGSWGHEVGGLGSTGVGVRHQQLEATAITNEVFQYFNNQCRVPNHHLMNIISIKIYLKISLLNLIFKFPSQKPHRKKYYLIRIFSFTSVK